MTGVNMGGLLLGMVALVVAGLVGLVALGLVIAGRWKPARITFASGVLAGCLIAAAATLTWLQRGMGFHREGDEPVIVLVALCLAVVGAGQFAAALRDGRAYAVAIGLAGGSAACVGALAAGAEAVGLRFVEQALTWASPSLPWLSVGLALGLLLALLVVLAAALPPARRADVLALTAVSALGGIGGFAAGDACVTTRATLLQGGPGNGPHHVRVVVEVLGGQVSDESGFVLIPNAGLELVRRATPQQVPWVYGPPILGALIGAFAAWGTGLLARAWLQGGPRAAPDKTER